MNPFTPLSSVARGTGTAADRAWSAPSTTRFRLSVPADARMQLATGWLLLVALAGLYPPADRRRVMSNFLDQMAREFQRSGMKPPPWLAKFAEEVRKGADEPARG